MSLAELGQQAFPFHQTEHGTDISHSPPSVNAQFALRRHNGRDNRIFDRTREHHAWNAENCRGRSRGRGIVGFGRSGGGSHGDTQCGGRPAPTTGRARQRGRQPGTPALPTGRPAFPPARTWCASAEAGTYTVDLTVRHHYQLTPSGGGASGTQTLKVDGSVQHRTRLRGIIDQHGGLPWRVVPGAVHRLCRYQWPVTVGDGCDRYPLDHLCDRLPARLPRDADHQPVGRPGDHRLRSIPASMMGP